MGKATLLIRAMIRKPQQNHRLPDPIRQKPHPRHPSLLQFLHQQNKPVRLIARQMAQQMVGKVKLGKIHTPKQLSHLV